MQHVMQPGRCLLHKICATGTNFLWLVLQAFFFGSWFNRLMWTPMGYPLPVCGPLWATHGLLRAHPKGNALIKKICAHPLAPERSQHCEPVHRGAWGEVKGPDVHPAPKKATYHAFCATHTEHTTRNLPQVLPRGSQRESGGARQGPPINHGRRHPLCSVESLPTAYVLCTSLY